MKVFDSVFVLIPCFLSLALSLGSSAQAQVQKPMADAAQKPNTAQPSKKPATKKSKNGGQSKPISAARRMEMMAFLDAHHPEIRPLLKSLRKTRKANYQTALRTLDRDIRNLQLIKKRSPQRYKKSLELWVVRSKIKLAAAQLALKKLPKEKAALTNKLDKLIKRQYDLRIKLTVDDLANSAKRTERLAANLQRLHANRKTDITRQRQTIQRNAEMVLAARQKAVENRKNKPSGTGETPPPNKKKTGNRDKKNEGKPKAEK